MYNGIIFLISIYSYINFQCTDSVTVYCCYKLIPKKWDPPFYDPAVTNIWCENKCKANSSHYQYSGTNLNSCYCRGDTTLYAINWFHQCTTPYKCAGDSSEYCGGYEHGSKRITVSTIERTISYGITSPMPIASCKDMNTTDSIEKQSTPLTTTTVNSSTTKNIKNTVSSTDANGEWGMWNDWKFCEVNCVREDTTEGIQRRLRTCNSSICSGNDMEEKKCSKPGICEGMRPRKLLCKCPKRLVNTKWHILDGKNISNSEVKKMVLEDFDKNIKSEISVDKKTVSKEVRKKNSSEDKRKSAQSIGWGCIVFLILPIVFLIGIDILNCCIHFWTRHGVRLQNRIRPVPNIKDKKVISKPMQENDNIAESHYASRCGNNFHPDEMERETYQRRRDDSNEHSRDEWLQYI